MNVVTTDRQGYTFSQREVMENGYLRVPGRAARAGIQEYLASELELTDRSPNDVVKVFRPPEEVFKPESLETYKGADVTVGHPSDMVDAKSYKDVAVGHTVSDGRVEGDFVEVDLLIKDEKAIKDVQDGLVELSAGYKAEYVHEPGTTSDGEPYEFIQRDIRINHIALVERARAGREARIYDAKRGKHMATVTLDGQTIEVEDKATASLIERAFKDASEKAEKLKERMEKADEEYKAAKEEMDKMKAEMDKKDEDLEEAKKNSSDEAIAERIQAVSTVRDEAKKVAGEDFTTDSLDVTEIKRTALAKARPTIDWAQKEQAYIDAAWELGVNESAEDKARRSQDGVSADLQALYMSDGDKMVGDAEYQKFLQGGAK